MYKYRTQEKAVSESLSAFRVVSLTGARQVGKTTLVKRICASTGMPYVSLEDPIARAAATRDAEGWLAANPPPLAIDEIQHVPDLFSALKRRVDADSRPGQYLITGSALWLSMRTIGETLAGRVALLELWPFRAAEWEERTPFDFRQWTESGRLPAHDPTAHRSADTLDTLVLRSGFPEPAAMSSSVQRRIWFDSYVKTYLQRDVLDMIRIEHVAEYARLIRLAASRSAQLLNVSSIARDLGLPQPTVRRYLEWLRTTYQCFEVAPYATNRGKRLVRTPKLHWTDTAMAAALLGMDRWQALSDAQMSGALLESWVVGEIRKWVALNQDVGLFHWRSHGGGEVDLLLEFGGGVVAIEIKQGHRVDARDLRGLHECREALGARFLRGIVLYGGQETQPLDDRLAAVPLAVLL